MPDGRIFPMTAKILKVRKHATEIKYSLEMKNPVCTRSMSESKYFSFIKLIIHTSGISFGLISSFICFFKHRMKNLEPIIKRWKKFIFQRIGSRKGRNARPR